MTQAAPDSAGSGSGGSPYDTVASSATRFLTEVVAWIAGPWAAADVLGSAWWAIPTLLVLFALPALFNTPGDKRVTGIPTPGRVRIGVEMVLLAVALAGAWLVWPAWAAILVTVLGVSLLLTGLPRYRWLADGAPPV